MFRFEYPIILWLLVLIPIAIIGFIFFIKRKQKKINKNIDINLQKTVLPLLSYGKQRLKFILLLLTYFFLVVSAANPQIASSMDKKDRKGCDVMICLDISNSMLANDLSPDRLSRAKLAINQLITQMQGDRIGIVVFAGSSFTFLPLTSDYATAKMFTDVIDTKLVDNQGTNIQEALETARKSFGEEKNNNHSRTIVLISDGEDNQDSTEDLVKGISKDGIIVNCIGIGSKEGSKIPINTNGNIEYKKDKSGNIVITHLNEEALRKIANEGGGEYIRANNASLGLDNILKSINKMDKKQYAAMAYRDYNTIFYFPAFVAFLLILIEFLIYSAKNKIINRKLFFGKD